MDYGWKGKRVRHVDGREGVIEREDAWGPWIDLYIKCSDGSTGHVKLNAHGPDSGDAGWQWFVPDFGHHGPAWLPLGERGAPTVYEMDASTARAAGLDASGTQEA